MHYCALEGYLADRRKRKGFDRNGIPEDPALARLKLLRRTVRDDPTRLGKLVRFLKLSYMLRESSQVELAQTIAVLPHLYYVDLPEGMLADEPGYATLRLEVQARCPDLRKMTFNRGSERSFATLATGQIWANMEVLEVNKLNVDPRVMRAVLGSMGNLRALKITESQSFSDAMFTCGDGLAAMPPLEELVLRETPRVTAAGLLEYLAWQETRQALRVLTLQDTSVSISALQDILAMAPALETLAVQTTVSENFAPAPSVPPLSSESLRTLRFEISGPETTGAWAGVTAGYYSYLVASILSDGLPQLRRLYVEDDTLPDQLQGLPQPNAAFAGGQLRPSSSDKSLRSPRQAFQLTPASNGLLLASTAPPARRPVSNAVPAATNNRFSSNNPFASGTTPSPSAPHTLEIFTKSEDFGKWNFARINALSLSEPPAQHSRRPVSSYGLGADVQGAGWERGDARRSVMVGSGAGGFLEVEGGRDEMSLFCTSNEKLGARDEWRPTSSAGSTKGKRDLWR